MLQYCEGDTAAFRTLYQKHSQALYRYIAWQAPRQDWADEVMQDTWLRLHDARKSYQPTASFKTFLYQIAKNRLIDLMRQRRDILASELGSHDDEENDIFMHLIDQEHAEDSPEQGLSQRQRQSELYDAIRKLPAEQREVLTAYHFSELSLDEIAQMTGANKEAVKSRLRYAMQKLRQYLGESDAFPDE